MLLFDGFGGWGGGGDFLILFSMFWKCRNGRVLLFRIWRGGDKFLRFDDIVIVEFRGVKGRLLLVMLFFDLIGWLYVFDCIEFIRGGREILLLR